MPCERGTLVPAMDGLPARCVGRWSGDKLHYFREYLGLFSNAIHEKFPTRHYVDLFGGPGRCRFDDDSGEIDGSPLLALSVRHPFSKYHFVDTGPAALDALKRRIELRGIAADVAFYQSDANDVVDSLRATIPEAALSVVVADPTGLDLRFEALERLVNGRRMDLIYLFPEGMAAKRNLEKFLPKSVSALDEVLGSREWRRRVPARLPDTDGVDQNHWELVGRPIVEVLRQQLGRLGYREVSLGSEVLVRSTVRNLPLYYLVFASKHELGHKFWNAIRRTDPTGQIQLPFSGCG
jgi:three-Cys-motif partner protein